MDIPDNYYAILGVPFDADQDTIKRAYRQLARQFHPDLAGEVGAAQMKRVNRAYDVLSDPKQRLNYDTISGGVIDFRKGGLSRPRPVDRRYDPLADNEFAGLSVFSTRGPLHAGAVLRGGVGVISALASIRDDHGLLVAAGSLDGKGLLWRVGNEEAYIRFAADPALPVESLRELRFSPGGSLLVGWGRLGMHVWNSQSGSLLWSLPLTRRAVSAHYSLDAVLRETNGQTVTMALPLLSPDPLGPRSLGVRGTDVIDHTLDAPAEVLSAPLVCAEDEIEKRRFWSIRLRALARDTPTLLTLSCAHVPGEAGEMTVARLWNLQARARFGKNTRPQIATSLVLGSCADYTAPYTVTPDARMLALTCMMEKVRIYDIAGQTFSEVASGALGGSAKLALASDALRLAVAREDSEITEGVVDLWSLAEGKLVQRLYHPWQISALHFSSQNLLVALTNGAIHVWE